VKKFNGEDVNTISPTLGFNIKTLEYKGYVVWCASISLSYPACSTSLVFWDIGGQRSLRSYWRNYFEQTDGIIWVVDSADRRRLLDCKAELDKLLVEEALSALITLMTKFLTICPHRDLQVLLCAFLRISKIFPAR